MTTTEHSLQTAPHLSDTLKRYSSIATFIGLVFLALLVSGIFFEGGGLAGPGMSHFLRAYLVGFWLWFGAGAGCLVILMTQYLTGGAWGVVINAGPLVPAPARFARRERRRVFQPIGSR